MSRGKFISTISAAAILLAPLSLHAASVDRQYRESLLHVKGLAEAAAVQAHQLELYGANSMTSSDVPQSALYKLKSEVNAMGKQLDGLEANRGSLTRWEQNAVVSVLPLAEDAARNTESAIRFYNAHKPRVESLEFHSETDKVRLDAEQVAKTIKTYFRNKAAREDEQSPTPRGSEGGN